LASEMPLLTDRRGAHATSLANAPHLLQYTAAVDMANMVALHEQCTCTGKSARGRDDATVSLFLLF